jgi:hypothetical protein
MEEVGNGLEEEKRRANEGSLLRWLELSDKALHTLMDAGLNGYYGARATCTNH